MICSICNQEAPGGIQILDMHLCPCCEQRLLSISAERREYDWYVSFVKKSLAEPLVAAVGRVIDIDEYRLRKIST